MIHFQEVSSTRFSVPEYVEFNTRALKTNEKCCKNTPQAAKVHFSTSLSSLGGQTTTNAWYMNAASINIHMNATNVK